MAATIPAVGAPGVEFVWAKLLSATPAPNNRIKTSAIFLFMVKLKLSPGHGALDYSKVSAFVINDPLDAIGAEAFGFQSTDLSAERVGPALTLVYPHI